MVLHYYFKLIDLYYYFILIVLYLRCGFMDILCFYVIAYMYLLYTVFMYYVRNDVINEYKQTNIKCQNWASSGPLRVAAGQSWSGSGT